MHPEERRITSGDLAGTLYLVESYYGYGDLSILTALSPLAKPFLA